MKNTKKLVNNLVMPNEHKSSSKNISQLHEFYLVGSIGSPDEYVDWFDVIRNAGPADTVKIYINSTGGDLYTAIQFLRVMVESEAEIITSVEGACMSAATMIFLAGHKFEITPYSMFMFHNYSGGVVGKGAEMHDQIVYERKWSQQFLKDIYANFLTPDEIQAILDNKDLWLTTEEVIERAKGLMEYRQKEHDEEEEPEVEKESQVA